jgi:hypothetical protein
LFHAKTQFTAEKGEIVSTQSRKSPQRKENFIFIVLLFLIIVSRKDAVHRRGRRNGFNAEPQITAEKREFHSHCVTVSHNCFTQRRSSPQRKGVIHFHCVTVSHNFSRKDAVHRRGRRNSFNAEPQITAEPGIRNRGGLIQHQVSTLLATELTQRPREGLRK